MPNKLRLAWQLIKYLGPSWLFFRILYAVQMRSGLLRRRMPAVAWSARPLSAWLKPEVPSDPAAYRAWRRQYGGRFFFDSLPDIDPSAPWNTHQAVEEANAILAGNWRYFQHTTYEVGFPPDWHQNPMTGQHILADRHWTQINEFAQGDIKLVWEANRFSGVYTLVRAYAATKDERYPEGFWKLVEDWAVKNPPNMGPNWRCGQETALRLMAWIFGLYGFMDSRHSTPERIASVATMIAAQAERIVRNLTYAYSTKSNHGISEAVGIWTVGLLFPEFALASKWRALGHRMLEKEIRRQIYADGSYVMPSFNYYRMSLQACLWAIQLGKLNQVPLAADVCDRVSQGIDFLNRLHDPQSGQLPNFGSNDGGTFFALDNCDYTNYLPIIQLGYYATHHEHLFEEGPWNEDLLWLFGAEALDTPLINKYSRKIDDLAATEGGYYTLHGEASWAMIHCAHFTDRPSQIDQLHMDLWWRGINIACDPGTYLYNGSPPWRNGLASTGVHNTVQVDGQEQMTQVGHFTWVDWAQGNVRCQLQSEAGHLSYWEGEHHGYQRLPEPALHRRSVIRIGAEHWLVADQLQGGGDHTYRLHWLIPDFPCSWEASSGTLLINTPQGPYSLIAWCNSADADKLLVVGDKHTAQGWRSLYYGHKQNALSLTIQATGSTVQFWTLFGPDFELEVVDAKAVQIATPSWLARVHIGTDPSSKQLVRKVTLSGAIEDSLEVLP